MAKIDSDTEEILTEEQLAALKAEQRKQGICEALPAGRTKFGKLPKTGHSAQPCTQRRCAPSPKQPPPNVKAAPQPSPLAADSEGNGGGAD